VTHDFRPPPDWVTTRRRWSTCPDCGKRSYATRGDARRRRRQQVKEYGEKLSELQIYRCRVGNSGVFHLGHPKAFSGEPESEAS
jgi:hypothetical protein